MSSASHAPSLALLRRILQRRTPTRPVDSVAQYLERRAASLTPQRLKNLLPELPLLRLQFASLATPGFPNLPMQLQLLAEFFADAAKGVFPGIPEQVQKEIAVALQHVANCTDGVPGIGYADDSLLVRTVLERHRALLIDYCRFRNLRWSTVPLDP